MSDPVKPYSIATTKNALGDYEATGTCRCGYRTRASASMCGVTEGGRNTTGDENDVLNQVYKRMKNHQCEVNECM